MSEDLERVRSGLYPVAADVEQTKTNTVPLPPFSSDRGERTKRTAVQPSPTAPSPKVPGGLTRRWQRLLPNIFALLVIVILLGGLIWALARGADDQSGAEDAEYSRMVQVPDLVYAETAESDLAAVGLRLGRQDEAPSDTEPIGVVTEQDPAEGTQAEESTAVDIVVSTSPQQAPIGNGQEAEKEREKQQQEAEKQREKQQQEEEKQREKGE